ncbi:aldehyde dehydrogenase family protein [Microbacterium sp. No. 7]|uniref:aldehyde dehydrogenase family protein n=1 Tax=Microbacterium sp. No. 7 TaxID=1714373 RepID=UPI0006D0DBCE|nr:aldehyde dehydrogenase family protein [Microbacterium sp. No. 7]ALJ21121.1 aldehyde dehydrogenase [Microbacterium sp. No. 7]
MRKLSAVVPAIIGGERVLTGAAFDVIDPSSGTVVGQVALCGPPEVDRAVAAARTAFRTTWRHVSAAGRARHLRAIAAIFQQHADELAELETLDTGKPLSQSRIDVGFAIRYFEYYANMVEAVFGDVIPVGTDRLTLAIREPHGVTGHIVPWNYPLGLSTRTIAPSIAAGNCCVLKPAEDASLTPSRISELALEAGLPAGVLNCVTGPGGVTGQALVEHHDVDYISFTGSVPVGHRIAAAAAHTLTPVALELGGKSPNIVFADADLDEAAPVLARSIIQNAGQTCSAGSRLLVADEVHDELQGRLVEIFRATRIGPGEEDPDLGPVISAKQLGSVTDMIERGKQEATLLTGGGRAAEPRLAGGYFVEPTLFGDVAPEASIFQQEIFGPVLTLTRFRDIDEAIELANGTEYGLVSGVWTGSISTAHRMIQELDSGQVMVNTFSNGVELPFSGRRKSGYGVEKGYDGLLAFTKVKGAVIAWSRS